MGKLQKPSTAASESQLSEASNSASISVTIRCSLNKVLNQHASLAISDRAMYLASVDESAITICFFEY
jgi:hypothetical protein